MLCVAAVRDQLGAGCFCRRFLGGCRFSGATVSVGLGRGSSPAWWLRSCGSAVLRVAGPWAGSEGVRRGRGGTSGEPWRLWGRVPLWFPRSGRRPDVRWPWPVPGRPACATVSVCGCAVPRWPGVLPVPRFRWLVCGSSLAGRLPVPLEGFDFDFDLDLDVDFGFDLPSAPFLISPSGCGGEIRNGADGSARRADAGRRGCGPDGRGAQWPHAVLRACGGAVWWVWGGRGPLWAGLWGLAGPCVRGWRGGVCWNARAG